jgi:bacterioferritin-associated ferredoxin
LTLSTTTLDIDTRSHYHSFVLVCHCLRVFDGEIRECVQRGARSCDEVADRCGAGSACGGCRDSIESLLKRDQSAPKARVQLAPAAKT